MEKEKIIGCWKLVSHEFKNKDGNIFKPYGENAVGWVMFDADGRFAAQIMRPDRPGITSGDATKDEMRIALMGYVAYFGTYEINEKEGILTNHVLGSLVPEWVGGDQIRYFEFSGENIILRTPPIKAGESEIEGTLVWEKA